MTRMAWTLALCVACSRPSESTDAKRSPRPPPATSVAIPATVHVDVEIDGVPSPAVDAARLGSIKPDFSNDEHRVWRVASLVGAAAAGPGVVIAAQGDNGVTLEMPAPAAPGDPIPTLSLNRRGDVVVGLVAPDDPFPDYHGRGGRLNRPGDRLPRVYGPTRIRIIHGQDAGR